MPWIAPSHQAPVLPLKLWKPHLFSGLALCLGAAAPDLEFILRIDYNWIVSHTFAAQMFFTVPLVMVLHAILTTVAFPWLLPLIPNRPPFHVHDLILVRPATSVRDWVRIGLSGWLGGITHVLLDGFTHGNHSGWITTHVPLLRALVPLPFGRLPLHDVLHVVGTVVLGVLSVRWLAEMGRQRLLVTWSDHTVPPRVRPATPAEQRGAMQYVLVCAALGVMAGLARRDDRLGPWFEVVAHGILAFVFYGIVTAAILDRVRARRAPKIASILDAGEA
jgi:Domain of unknown function (DUF4184)